MTAMTEVRPLPITGCGVVSTAGLGLGALGGLLRGDAAAPAVTAEDSADDLGPPRDTLPVRDLRLADHVGRKGTRHIDRLTALSLVASRQALAPSGAGPARATDRRPDTGVVLGTSTGSVTSMARMSRDTLTQDPPYLVNPAEFPNMVMNAAAGQVAIWNGLAGPNATVAAGQVSALFAVRQARSTLNAGRAARLLVGGVEELSPYSAWAWHRSRALERDAALGEGCAVVVVEPAAAPVLGVLLACEVRLCAPDAEDVAAGLVACIRRALQRSGVEPEQVERVALGSGGLRRLAGAERRAVAATLGTGAELLDVASALGVTYSASGALQVAALLALLDEDGDAAPGADRFAVATSAGPDGNVGCLVLGRPVTVRRAAPPA